LESAKIVIERGEAWMPGPKPLLENHKRAKITSLSACKAARILAEHAEMIEHIGGLLAVLAEMKLCLSESQLKERQGGAVVSLNALGRTQAAPRLQAQALNFEVAGIRRLVHDLHRAAIKAEGGEVIAAIFVSGCEIDQDLRCILMILALGVLQDSQRLSKQ